MPPTRTATAGRVISVAARLRRVLILLAVLLILGGGSFHGVLTGLRTARAERARMVELVALSAAQVRGAGAVAPFASFGGLVPALTQDSSAARAWAERMGQALLARRNVSAWAVIDAEGTVVFHWPDVAGAPVLAPPSDGTRPADPWVLTVTQPVPLVQAWASLGAGNSKTGYVCLIGPRGSVTAAALGAGLRFAGGLALVALVAGLAGDRHLRRTVVRPLARLTQAAPRHRDGATRNENPRQDSHDELSQVALHLDDLTSALHGARQDARRLERSIDATVNRRVTKISSQLRSAEREAETDALTGLANRRFIEQRLESVFEEQRACGVNFAMVMFDVDNFKPLNDTAGHAAGDALLRFVGELLRGSLREHDVGIRYGGDEFGLVLIDVSGEQARKIAERIVRMFAQQTAVANLPAPVTLSAGVASLDEVNAKSGAELMAQADAALYESKRRGKNLVRSAS
jgi:diguanylate cyclase (GGDEF)-like protein